MTQNTIENIRTNGKIRTGVCIHGPLVGKRVVSNDNGPWMPAGEATLEEMQRARGDMFSDALDHLFGRSRRTP